MLPSMSMIHLLILAVHLLATIAKLVRPGGVRVVPAHAILDHYAWRPLPRSVPDADPTVIYEFAMDRSQIRGPLQPAA